MPSVNGGKPQLPLQPSTTLHLLPLCLLHRANTFNRESLRLRLSLAVAVSPLQLLQPHLLPDPPHPLHLPLPTSYRKTRRPVSDRIEFCHTLLVFSTTLQHLPFSPAFLTFHFRRACFQRSRRPGILTATRRNKGSPQ